MSEPEEVILDGAHHTATAIASLWRRHSGRPTIPEVRLADVRGRLELFTRALFPNALPLGVAEPPAVPNWFARIAWRLPGHLVRRQAIASTDGAQVRLPRSLDAPRGWEPAFARYRLLATGLMLRAERGSHEQVPDIDDALVHDLYLLRESVQVDRRLVNELPGLAADLIAAKHDAISERPAASLLTSSERAVDYLVRQALAADPRLPLPAFDSPDDPDGSSAWARATADSLRDASRYRGLPPVSVWGLLDTPPSSATGGRSSASMPYEDEEPLDGARVRTLVRRPRVRQAPEGEDDDEVGMWMVQIDDPQESVEDPMGLQRPTDTDTNADPADLADSLSELPEARLVTTPGAPKEVLQSDDPPDATASGVRIDGVPAPRGIAYPEWDWRSETYREGHAVVRERTATPGDQQWVEQTLARYGSEIHRIRRQFEHLRPNRIRLGRQTDGPDIDLAACVAAWVDERAGRVADDRLYEDVRPARRDLSILLLADVSGSTDSWVADTRRIIDVEKDALLLVCEALDALGDGYAIMGFSGEGPRAVSALTLKSFTELYGPVVRQRIAGLAPDRFTRTGAAIRHATASLAAQGTRHRLLLLFSDGKPNDVDLYEGRYGVEDTRQAVAEARLEGIEVYCLTVDRQATVYLPRIFGPNGYTVLRHAAVLPRVLVDVVRMLLNA